MIPNPLLREARRTALSPALALCVATIPAALTLAIGVAVVDDRTRPAVEAVIRGEYAPIELSTIAFLLAAGVLGIRNALRVRARSRWAAAFHGAFALGVVLVACEEAAWGQHFIGFETPEAFRDNVQRELTIHNLPGLHGHSEFLRVAFGYGGLVGVLLARWRRFELVAASPLLIPTLAVIAVLATGDLAVDFRSLSWSLDRGFNMMSETVEMLVSVGALGYAWLCGRRLGNADDA